MPKKKPNDEAVLARIRDRYEYAIRQWKDIRAEARTDVRFLMGDPWDEKVKSERQANGRQCINFDELNQYCNQVINQVRQNMTAITVRPKGFGASDATAELHQGIIRDIEYDSKAQAAYVTAFEGGLQRSYGFARVGTEYVSSKGFEQRITIDRIPNPDSVLMDPDCKQADCSDAKFCFVVDRMRYAEFKREYPKAKFHSFGADEMRIAIDWFFEKEVLVGEYWEVEEDPRTLLLFEEGERPALDSDDEHTDPQLGHLEDYEGGEIEEEEDESGTSSRYLRLGEKRHKVKDVRDVGKARVVQYITNGLEILETHEVPGPYIPIAGCYGKEMYVDTGSGSKKVLVSLIRLARDPAMAYAYLRSQELEEAALTPRAPFIAYKGQLEGYEDDWQEVNRKAKAFLLVNELTDSGTGQLLPVPSRPNFNPNFQSYEVAAEACRRAIQAACGIMPLPTSAQRQNEKSGVALDRVQTQEAIGSYHFVDNYRRFLEHIGRIVESWLPEYYDSKREVGFRKDDGTHQIIRINDPEYKDPTTGEPKHLRIDEGEHEITVTTGPSMQSQREAAEDFANLLAKTEAFPAIADLIVRMKKDQIGPLADQIAERLTPPQFAKKDSPQAAFQQVQQAQQQMAALNETLKIYEQKIQQLEFEKKANVVSNEYKLQAENLKLEVQAAIAEITTKAQQLSERETFVNDVWTKLQDHAHERQMAEDARNHEVAQADAARQAAAAATPQGPQATGAAAPPASPEMTGGPGPGQ